MHLFLEDDRCDFDRAEYRPADCSSVFSGSQVSGSGAETQYGARPSTCPRSGFAQHFEDSHVPWYRTNSLLDEIKRLRSSLVSESMSDIRDVAPAEIRKKAAHLRDGPTLRDMLSGFYLGCRTGGGVHLPLVTASSGQYARMYNEKSPSLGDGSQLARCPELVGPSGWT